MIRNKKKVALGDPRLWPKRIAAVSNPNDGQAVRVAQEGICNATIRHTGTERQCSFLSNIIAGALGPHPNLPGRFPGV